MHTLERARASAAAQHFEENSLALEFYEKALSYNSLLNDKALYYMAKTCGYSGKTTEKIEHLNTILTEYSDSKYVMNATYELAKTYSSIGKDDDALSYYQRFLEDYPNSPFIIEAQIGEANSYFKKWEYVKAETAYLKVLSEHENETDICEVAAKGLLDIYTAQNKPTKAADVVERYSCIDYSEDEKENLFYGPADRVVPSPLPLIRMAELLQGLGGVFRVVALLGGAGWRGASTSSAVPGSLLRRSSRSAIASIV